MQRWKHEVHIQYASHKKQSISNTWAELSGFKTANAPKISGSTPITHLESALPGPESTPSFSDLGQERDSNQFNLSCWASKTTFLARVLLLVELLDLDFFGVEGSGIVSISGSRVVVEAEAEAEAETEAGGVDAAKSLNAAGVRRRRSGGGGRKANDGDINIGGFGGKLTAVSMKSVWKIQKSYCYLLKRLRILHYKIYYYATKMLLTCSILQ